MLEIRNNEVSRVQLSYILISLKTRQGQEEDINYVARILNNNSDLRLSSAKIRLNRIQKKKIKQIYMSNKLINRTEIRLGME